MIYKHERGVICFGSKEERACIRKGVRQDFSLSSYLFHLFVQKTIDKVKKEVQVNVKVHGERIEMLKFTDDTVLMIIYQIYIEYLVQDNGRGF